MALGSIRSNKLRAGLTLLSIAIGVFAIVGVGASVGVLDAKVNDQLASMGRNSFIIQRDPPINIGRGRGNRNRKDITVRQGLELKERLTSAESVGLTSFVMGPVAKRETEETEPGLIVFGSDETFIVNYDYDLAEGRSIDPSDVQSGADVAVIGSDVADKLFPSGTPIGQDIKINNHRYTVVGRLESKGAVFGQSQDNRIVIPITSATKYFFDQWSSSISLLIRSNSMEDLDETVDQATGLMRMIRRVGIGEPNDFEVSTNESISETFGGFTEYISIFGLGCGMIALLAAGIGIMNIMLVTVKERTREIGIRKAIGATRGNILSQFLIEAVTLTQLGAFSGAAVGLLGGLGISGLIGVSMPIPWLSVGAALGICLFIGIVFGGYPAWKASKLDPIEALRYE
jgi:putative ABC transport system permease protein